MNACPECGGELIDVGDEILQCSTCGYAINVMHELGKNDDD